MSMFNWDFSSTAKGNVQSSFSPIMQIFQDVGGDVSPVTTTSERQDLSAPDNGSPINSVPQYNPVNDSSGISSLTDNSNLYLIAIAGVILLLILKRKK